MNPDRDYQGPPIDDFETLARLSNDLADLLSRVNGFVRYGGGLHVRGACQGPDWHSLRHAWDGEDALHRLYPGIVRPDDIPFGEDYLGDQFLLREGRVWNLGAETGDLDELGIGLAAFLAKVEADPVPSLDMEPLVMFEEEGGLLEPGELLAADPPFSTDEPIDAIDLRPVANLERRRSLADLAAQFGGRVEPPSTPPGPTD